MKSIDELALEVADKIAGLVWTEGTMSEEGALPVHIQKFAHRFLAAWIAQQEPVAWLHSHRKDSSVITDKVKHVWGGVAVGREAQYTIPLYTLPTKEELK